MAWRVALSLERLRHQIDAQFPGRSVAFGSIGDSEHQKRGKDSDHNPWFCSGIVTARDFTHDPAHGLDFQQLADQLLESLDPRIKYVIANRRIATNRDWQWGPYDGVNPHERRVHLSVVADPRCDVVGDWALPVWAAEVTGAAERKTARCSSLPGGEQVNIRQAPSLGAPVVMVLQGPTRVGVRCQTVGETMTTAGHTNDAWSFIPALGGYFSNIFIDHPAAWLPDVGEC